MRRFSDFLDELDGPTFWILGAALVLAWGNFVLATLAMFG